MAILICNRRECGRKLAATIDPDRLLFPCGTEVIPVPKLIVICPTCGSKVKWRASPRFPVDKRARDVHD